MGELSRRVRLFAGPNGSGKSTIKRLVTRRLGQELMGVVIDPDDIESDILKKQSVDFRDYSIEITKKEILDALSCSAVLDKQKLLGNITLLDIEDNIIEFPIVMVNSYIASAVSELIRNRLIMTGHSFSFESVMSHISKIELLKKAQEQGYRTYLYYVATDDADINIMRVKNRVLEGGHNVSEDKIRDRYFRSIELLINAIQYTNRAYIFDNSGNESVLMVEITDGKDWIIKSDIIHPWFAPTFTYLQEHSIEIT